MSSSLTIEWQCRPFFECTETVSTNLARMAAAEPKPRRRCPPQTPPRTASRPGHYVGRRHSGDADDGCDIWDDHIYDAYADDDSMGADLQKVEEYLLNMFKTAEPAVVVDVATAAAAGTPNTFGAIAWGKEQLRELLAPQVTTPALPEWVAGTAESVQAEPDEWVDVEECLTPRTVNSEISWADCGQAAVETRTYAAVISQPGVWTLPVARAAGPKTHRTPSKRRAEARECPMIPECEEAKEERVLSGEQSRWNMHKEKLHSGARARRMERKGELGQLTHAGKHEIMSRRSTAVAA